MTWENPIKTARICFHETGRIIEHYISVEDNDAIDRLILFLCENKAVIVDLEDFTQEEVERLLSAQDRKGQSLLASDACFARWDGVHRQRCAIVCRLNADEGSVEDAKEVAPTPSPRRL